MSSMKVSVLCLVVPTLAQMGLPISRRWGLMSMHDLENEGPKWSNELSKPVRYSAD